LLPKNLSIDEYQLPGGQGLFGADVIFIKLSHIDRAEIKACSGRLQNNSSGCIVGGYNEE